MGYDDGVCEAAPDGVHVFALEELVVNATGAGMAKVHRCALCGGELYEASEAAARPPL